MNLEKYTCDTCKQLFDYDEIMDRENCICETCHDKRCKEEYAYFKPIYDGEVLAGLHQRDDE